MEQEKSKKENFEKMALNAFHNREKFDYFGIAEQGTKAFICGSELSTIRNAIIIANWQNRVLEWEVVNREIKKCPEKLFVCIKNLKVLLGCMGEPDNEESYFSFMRMREDMRQELEIFGAIEVYEYAIVFYYNCKTLQSWYMAQPAYSDSSTDIFELIKKLRYMEGLLHEKKEWPRRRLENQAYASSTLWGSDFQ